MALTLDFSSDYLIWDNPESITYRSRTNLGDTDVTVTEGAIRQQYAKQEPFPTEGVYQKYSLQWFVAGTLLSSVTPKMADQIIDSANVIWTILNTSYEDLDQVWDFAAVNLSLAADLKDLVTILEPITDQDAAGGRIVREYHKKHFDIEARIQQVSQETVEQHGKLGRRRAFEVVVGTRLEIADGALLVNQATGEQYQVTGYSQPDQIDMLQQVQVELMP